MNVHVIPMKQDKVCKGSIRFVTTDDEAAATNVYVNKTALKPVGGSPRNCLVVIIPLPDGEDDLIVAKEVREALKELGSDAKL